jgi:hypothetical protein
MSAKRAPTRPQWNPPRTEELVVIERQIREAIPVGENIKTLPYGEGGWGPWDSNLGDLIERAFGPESAQASSYHYAGYSFGGTDTRGMSAERAEAIKAAERNDSITSKIAAAQGVLTAIGQELERRGAQPSGRGIARRSASTSSRRSRCARSRRGTTRSCARRPTVRRRRQRSSRDR